MESAASGFIVPTGRRWLVIFSPGVIVQKRLHCGLLALKIGTCWLIYVCFSFYSDLFNNYLEGDYDESIFGYGLFFG